MRGRTLVLLAVLAVVVLLRLAGITWGWPFTFNADEPHLVNIAVSFGGGSLRPYDFKYPTLWPYVLFVSYGLYFLAWSFFGLRHHLSEFVGLFAWRPGIFYLIGRLLAAVFSLAGAFLVYRLEKKRRPGRWPWAALLLVCAPIVNEVAHSCKPDCLMFFMACGAWVCALDVQAEGSRARHWLCGAFTGLAVSTQYTAAPLAALLPAAHLLCAQKPRRLWLLEGIACAAAAFFVASPYIVIDFSRFAASMKDFADLAKITPYDGAALRRQVVSNLWTFAGPGSIGGFLALIGLARLSFKDRRLALLLFVPILAQYLLVSSNPDGNWQRYLLAAFPGLALLAAEACAWAESAGRPLLTVLVVVLALVPGLLKSAWADQLMRLPDTRPQAQEWIANNVKPGATILLDEPHAEPLLAMTKDEVVELEEKTKTAGSPRWKLYHGMAASHPGGGYRLYRLRRSALELYSGPRQVELSQADSPTLDVRPGLDTALALRVDYVVTSSYGAGPERAPELAGFFSELYAQAELVKDFVPVPGASAGPVLRVFKLSRSVSVTPIDARQR